MSSFDDNLKDEAQLTDALSKLFGLRLQILIGYDNNDFTRELVSYFLERLRVYSTYKGYDMFYHNVIEALVDAVWISPYDKYAQNVATNLVTRVERFVTLSYQSLYGDVPSNSSQADGKTTITDYRAEIGKRFTEYMNKNNKKNRSGFNKYNIISQLRHVTDVRNEYAHRFTDGKTTAYKRYCYLQCFDVILAFLLYSFYHMMMNPNYTVKHLKAWL